MYALLRKLQVIEVCCGVGSLGCDAGTYAFCGHDALYTFFLSSFYQDDFSKVSVPLLVLFVFMIGDAKNFTSQAEEGFRFVLVSVPAISLQPIVATTLVTTAGVGAFCAVVATLRASAAFVLIQF